MDYRAAVWAVAGSSSREVAREVKKPRNVAAFAVFGACVAGAAWHQAGFWVLCPRINVPYIFHPTDLHDLLALGPLWSRYKNADEQQTSLQLSMSGKISIFPRRPGSEYVDPCRFCAAWQELASLLQANGVDVGQDCVDSDAVVRLAAMAMSSTSCSTTLGLNKHLAPILARALPIASSKRCLQPSSALAHRRQLVSSHESIESIR